MFILYVNIYLLLLSVLTVKTMHVCVCVRFTGSQNIEMAIDTDLFHQGFAISPHLINYKFQCIMSQPDGSSPGVGEIMLRLNTPPMDGSCTFLPVSATVMDDFTFACNGWVDNDGDGVANYQLVGELFCVDFVMIG